MLTILGRRGDGSDLAEAFLTLAGIPYELESLNYDVPGQDRERLLRHNRLGQVPTLLLPDGKILTESLAVAVYAQRRTPKAGLIPEDRDEFWRYAVMLVAQIYPTFTYGDDPKKWVDESASAALRQSTQDRCKELWSFMETEVQGPYFLGEAMCALDIYVKVMLGWRPGREWFEGHTPKLLGIAQRVQKDPRFKHIWE